MNRRTLLTSLVIASALVVPISAFEKPNFSGAWKMNASKSDFGPMPAPDTLERKITHEDPSLKWSQTQSGQQGTATTEVAYTTDGKPSTNKTPRGEVTGVAKWDGDVLTINSKREVQGMEITQAERWTLSPDGKTLTITNKLTAPQGEFELKVVLEKQ